MPGFVRYVSVPPRIRLHFHSCILTLAYNCTNREDSASALKIVDDFIATRKKQLLDSRIVTFNLKVSKQRKLHHTPVKLWTLLQLEGMKIVTKRTDNRGGRRSGGKKQKT